MRGIRPSGEQASPAPDSGCRFTSRAVLPYLRRACARRRPRGGPPPRRPVPVLSPRPARGPTSSSPRIHDRRHRPRGPGPTPRRPRADEDRAPPRDRRPGAGDRPDPARRPDPRPLPPRRRAGPGEDADDLELGADDGVVLQPHPVHARPDAGRHHRQRAAAHRPGDERAHRSASPPGRSSRTCSSPTRSTGRRPRPRPPCSRPCRSARSPRRQAPRAARPVLRPRHPEPDRAGGHLSAARGPARPLHVHGPASTTRPPTRNARSCKRTTGSSIGRGSAVR